MQTLPITAEALQACIARFAQVPSQKSAAAEALGIPQAANELIAARDIRYYMGPAGARPAAASGTAPSVEGPAGLSVYVVECPPSQGPLLHAHWRTHESFLCLSGRFEVRMGPQGEHAAVLEPLDMVACPLGVARAFKNISDAPARLLVMIRGDGTDMSDIAYAPAVGQLLGERFGPSVVQAFEHIGIRFDAGTP